MASHSSSSSNTRLSATSLALRAQHAPLAAMAAQQLQVSHRRQQQHKPLQKQRRGLTGKMLQPLQQPGHGMWVSSLGVTRAQQQGSKLGRL
jgi:hypothetical protein